jgi:hypothetical protein
MARMDEKPRRRRLRSSLRTLLELIAAVAVVLGFVLYRQVAMHMTGRFQLQEAGGQVFVIDTQTGRVWSRHAFYGNWSECMVYQPPT